MIYRLYSESRKALLVNTETNIPIFTHFLLDFDGVTCMRESLLSGSVFCTAVQSDFTYLKFGSIGWGKEDKNKNM